jgi:tetratricopeptide (TPR) repeat protein
MEMLLSSQTGLQQKRALWAQLRQTVQLDRAIAELEQRAASDPTATEYPTALGEAYLYKIETVEDARDHAILGLKADQSFDAALKLDPANWEAGFYKTAALARWPDNLNKGAEVVQRFSDLIQLQETMTPRPEFAATYVLLGEQYQKAGQPDNARQVWLRGASLFPSSPSLQAKLTPGP